jgi:virginiamycin B lyase
LDSIGTYNLTTHEFAKYQVPGELLGQAGALFGILHAGYGNTIVFSMAAQNQVGVFNIDTKQFTIYNMPTLASFPVGVNVDQNTGHIWVSEAAGMKLAEIDPATGHITEYPLLSFGTVLTLLLGDGVLGSPLPSPGPIIQADDGNMYFLISFPVAVGLGNAIARMNPVTHQVTVWKTPSSFSSPCALSQEHHGEIWFSELEQNKIAKFQYA